MKRPVFILGLLLRLFFVCSYCDGSITFYNDCPACTSIKITITVPAAAGSASYEEELILGDYNSLVYTVPHYGDYFIFATCLNGIEYSWSDYYSFNTGAVDSIYFACSPSTTTSSLSHQQCPVTLLYGEDSRETVLLRYLRDRILRNTPEGQELMLLYYQWSPAIVEGVEANEEFKKGVKELIDEVLAMIEITFHAR